MQSFRIAFKNIIRQRKRSFLLGGAVAFGFFIFTLINGFTGGLLQVVSDNLVNALGGHIYASGSEVSDQGSEIEVVRDLSTLDKALAVLGEQVISYNTRSSANTTLIFGGKEETMLVAGVDTSLETGFLDGLSFIKGSPQAFLDNKLGIIIPEDTRKKLGLEVGESVIVKTTTIKGQQNVGDLVVVGSLAEAQGFDFTSAYAHNESLNPLLAMTPEQFQTLSIKIRDLEKLDELTDSFYQELAKTAEVEERDTDPGGPPDFARAFGLNFINTIDEAERWQGTKFAVTNLNEVLTGIDSLVNIMNNIGLLIFLIILIIIMVGVMNSYRMVMLERTAEIGTMRAMGVQKAGIRNIFIWEALLTALGGTLAGLLLAALGMFALSSIDFGVNDFAFS
ncbi:MAG: FtsX-like permease family protein [Deinococcales bacterium]